MRVHTAGQAARARRRPRELIARQTAGLAGADLANLCNEAAIFAARARRRHLIHADFDSAVERVVAGMQSRRTLTEHERRVVAWHEAGPRGVRRAAPVRQPRAQDLDRAARQRARVHAQPPRRGPLPQDARGADRPHDDAARRARRRGDRVRRRHHRRVGRPAQGRRDLALDDPRVRDGHVDHVAQDLRARRRGVRPHARAARRRAAAPRRRGAPRGDAADRRAPRASSTRWRTRCCATRCSSASTSTGSWPGRRASAAARAACASSRRRRRLSPRRARRRRARPSRARGRARGPRRRR